MDGWVLKDGRYYYMRMEQNCNADVIPVFTTDINSAAMFDKQDWAEYIGRKIWTLTALKMKLQKIRGYDGFRMELEK